MQLQTLLDILRQTQAYQALLDDFRANRPIAAQGVMRAARPFVVAALAQDLNRAIVLLTGQVIQAHNIVEQLPVWILHSRIRRFAEPTALFYERSPWASGAIQSRLNALTTLCEDVDSRHPDSERNPIIVASAYALMQKTLPIREYRANIRTLRAGRPTKPEKLLRHLIQVGYIPVSTVVEAGTFSRRGGILDVFPLAVEQPIRVEFFGDEIESLREFDPATQRSSKTIDEITIFPAREALPKYSHLVAQRLESWFEAQPTVEEDVTSAGPDQEALSNGMAFPHLEFYLSTLYSAPANLLDFVPDDSLIIVDDLSMLQDSVAELEEQAIGLRDEKTTAGQLPDDYPIPYVTWAELQDDLSTRRMLNLGRDPDSPFEEQETLGDLFVPGNRYGGRLKNVLEDLARFDRSGERIVVVTQQAQRIAELWSEQQAYLTPVSRLGDHGTLGSLSFVDGTLAEGWVLDAKQRLVLLTDAEIFGWKRPEPRRRKHPRAASPESSFADLTIGDYVVHVEYGIGRFGGLQKRVLDNSEREYLMIEYAGTDTLYVPIHQADRLSRYVGASDRPPHLSRLGTQDWQRTKDNTRRAVEETARELLELYAMRKQVQGHAFSPDTPWQHELEASFPYIETDDQLQALNEVKRDMERPQPMDRLICGDVGYGKTEVALRAAFKAVMDGKQTVVLVPTTVLAQQHFNTFSQRVHSFPVKVEMLSRFRNPAEQRTILHELANGQIDIIIGTHRLLQSDVKLKDLGLLIVDEEQRFGVTHKEQLKRLRTEVDVLTLTATPIPRTLYMSLTGVRDISMIQTPPEERLPILTHVGPYNVKLVRQAILREMDRGGQVFLVHNRVQTIETVAAKLRRLVPEATIAVGHGQMDENRLEEVMTAFAQGDYDVLLSTTIIESGIDIPNTNTLIVDRADWFGLSQLYQLRGRVGRGAHQAYAYFFHLASNRLTPEARARLETISEQTELGSGMSIAMRDLEIRGAGDLLGTRQSGHIAAVGFHLYTQLLAQAVKHLKGQGETPRMPVTSPIVTIDLPVPTFFPTTFIPSPSLRIQLYRRLAEIEAKETIDEIELELVDRFGPLPRAVQGLLFQLRVKLSAQAANATAVATENGQISVRLPYLATTDRAVLQKRLGHNVRVSRTAVWLPYSPEQTTWQTDLLDILDKLSISHIQTA